MPVLSSKSSEENGSNAGMRVVAMGVVVVDAVVVVVLVVEMQL